MLATIVQEGKLCCIWFHFVLQSLVLFVVGEQKRARRLVLTWVVSGTYLNRIADLKENVGTFLAFLCSSNWNEWYGANSRAKALVLSLRSDSGMI